MSKLDNIFFLFFKKRQLQDLNLRAIFTTDFKSVSLTTRTSCHYFLFFVFFDFILFYLLIVDFAILFLKVYLSNNSILGSLGKVRAHISLKIEISELVSLLQLQQSSKLGVRVNLATILLILKSV
jgi:hypothetical protein